MEEYYEDYYNRLNSGELQHRDSIHLDDSLKYTTPKGKIVYGGGGIMPDIFVPIDTIGRSYYYTELVYMGIFRQFAFDYADKHRDELQKISYNDFKVSDALLKELTDYAENKGVKKIDSEYNQSKELIRNMLRANIALHIWRNEGFYSIINEHDKVIARSLETI